LFAKVAYVTAFLGLVALLQGVAWLGGNTRRVALGAVLAPLGLLLVAGSVLGLLVPGFFAE
jgi:hypothetical protein